MQKQIQSAGKRGFFSKRSSGLHVKEKFTLEDMLCFQKVVPLPDSLNMIFIIKFEKALLASRKASSEFSCLPEEPLLSLYITFPEK